MSKVSDFSTVIYKILKYLDECQKKGCVPNMEIAQKIAKIEDSYFKNAIEEMDRKDLIVHDVFYADNVPYVESIRITLDGSEFLRENKAMKKVSRFIDRTFIPELNVTINLSLI